MSGIHIMRDVEVWFGQYRLRGQMNSCGLKSSIEITEGTVFLDSAKRRVAGGLRDTALSVEGFYNESDVGGPAFSKLGVMNVPVSVTTPGYNPAAVGSRAYFFNGGFGEYSSGAPVGALDKFSLTINGSDGAKLVRGIVAYDQRGVSLNGTVDGNSAAYNLGAVSAKGRLCAVVHCLSMDTGDTLDVSIESSPTQSPFVPTTRLTFDQFTQAGAEFKAVEGALAGPWYRVVVNVPNVSPAPRVNFVVVLGISN
jgi:hypothetical protein